MNKIIQLASISNFSGLEVNIQPSKNSNVRDTATLR